jgi:hypothetical protein
VIDKLEEPLADVLFIATFSSTMQLLTRVDEELNKCDPNPYHHPSVCGWKEQIEIDFILLFSLVRGHSNFIPVHATCSCLLRYKIVASIINAYCVTLFCEPIL